jgi:hypothetical protein
MGRWEVEGMGQRQEAKLKAGSSKEKAVGRNGDRERQKAESGKQ